MAAKRRTGRGSIAPGVGYTIFFHDQSANLAECKEWLFFAWSYDPAKVANYVQPDPDPVYYPSQDYDARWRWTTILRPHLIGRGGGSGTSPMTWEQIAEERQAAWTEDLQLAVEAIAAE